MTSAMRRHFALIQRMVSLARRSRQSDIILFLQHAHRARGLVTRIPTARFSAAPRATFFAVALSCAEQSFGTITACVRLRHRRCADRRQRFMRIGDASRINKKGRSCNAIQIRTESFFLILPARFHRDDNALMHGTVSFLVEILAVLPAGCGHATGLQGVNQQQTFIFTTLLK